MGPTRVNSSRYGFNRKSRLWFFSVNALIILLAITGSAMAKPGKGKSGDELSYRPVTDRCRGFKCTRKPKPAKDRECKSFGCEYAAQQLLSTIDPNISPCEDFHGYVCGRWSQHNVMPKDASIWTTADALKRKVDTQIREILEGDTVDRKDRGIEEVIYNMKSTYKQCLDVKEIERNGAKALKAVLSPYNGVIADMLHPFGDVKLPCPECLTFEQGLAAMHLRGVPAMFSASVIPDVEDPSIYKLYLTPNGLGLPNREDYSDPKLVEAYKQYLIEIFTFLKKASIPTMAMMDKSPTENAELVLDYETALASISFSEEDLGNPKLFETMSIQELQDWASNFEKPGPDETFLIFQWADYFKKLNFQGDTIMVSGKPYFQGLFQNFPSEKIIAFFPYMLARLVDKYAAVLSIVMRDARAKFELAISGSRQPERWLTCLHETVDAYEFVVGRIHARKYYDVRTNHEVQHAIDDIKYAMLLSLRNAQWLYSETTEVAEKKLSAMNVKVGYPEYINDDAWINNHYGGLEVKDIYAQTLISDYEFRTRRQIDLWNTSVNKNEWTSPPQVVDALYSVFRNELTVPEGFLTEPMFSHLYPASMNYGGLGALLGHKLTHGFDDFGQMFDKDGHYDHLWNAEEKDEYAGLARCFVRQYGDATYTKVEGNNVNIKAKDLHVLKEELTLRKSIADHSGLVQGWRAYKANKVDLISPKPLPGFSHLSNDKLFFINYARAFCGVVRSERSSLYNPYVPLKNRVNRAVYNMEEFEKAFKCEADRYYKPKAKCEVFK